MTATYDERRVRLVVVGHVDHGKSTLIGRLFLDTGSLPKDRLEALRARAGDAAKVDFAHVMDSLEEERARGITIDTTQAFFRGSADRPGGAREYVIIDTPGHKQFLRNTFTGASHAEAALLLVDAAEGIRDQTRRHVNILRMIGIRQIVVAANKMDVLEFEREPFEKLSAELRELLDGFELRAVVPAAARDGDNIARRSERTGWYEGPTVLEGLDSIDVEDTSERLPLRLPVQDAYEVEGVTLCVGRVESGRVAVGDAVVLRPSGASSSVASIRNPNGDEVREAAAGQSVGFTFAEGLVPERGEVVCRAAPDGEEGSVIPVGSRLESRVFWLSSPPLAAGAEFALRCATQEVGCRAESVKSWAAFSDDGGAGGKSELADGDLGVVVLSTERPLAVDVFRDAPQLGRVVVEKDGRTVGAGIVTAVLDDASGG